jgi:glycosyltransferase involved in cell wall biosynthesis
VASEDAGRRAIYALGDLGGAAMIDVSVIIMAFNEAPSVLPVLQELDTEMGIGQFSHEVIVVNDGSTDETERVSLAYADGHPHVRVISHSENRGIGEVYRTGFTAARGTYISFLPADGQFPARIIREFAMQMATNDLVLGYLPARQSSAAAKLLSKLERGLYRMLFGRLPAFQGVLMFRRGALESLGVRLGGRGWQVLMELIVRACKADYRIVSVPHELRPRLAGTSKVTNLRHVWANLRQAAAIRWRLSRFPVRRSVQRQWEAQSSSPPTT